MTVPAILLPVLETEGRAAKELAGYVNGQVDNGGTVPGPRAITPMLHREPILAHASGIRTLIQKEDGTAYGSALVEHDTGLRRTIDLSNAKALELEGWVEVVGAGFEVVIRKITWSSVGAALDGQPDATCGPSLALDTAGLITGASVAISAANRTKITIGVFIRGGDGTTIPEIGDLRLTATPANTAPTTVIPPDNCEMLPLPTLAVPGNTVLDLDAQTLCANSDGAVIASWPDQSTYARDGVAVGPDACTYEHDALGAGRAAVVTPGPATGNSGMRVPNPITDDFTVYIVGSTTGGNGSSPYGHENAALFDGDAAGVAGDYCCTMRTDGKIVADIAEWPSPPPGDTRSCMSTNSWNDGNPFLLVLRRSASTGLLEIRVNGSAEASTMTGILGHMGAVAYAYLGGGGLALGGPLNFKYGRVLAYDVVHDAGDTSAMEAALKSFYSIP